MGSRFPIIMNELYQGIIEYKNIYSNDSKKTAYDILEEWYELEKQ